MQSDKSSHNVECQEKTIFIQTEEDENTYHEIKNKAFGIWATHIPAQSLFTYFVFSLFEI